MPTWKTRVRRVVVWVMAAGVVGAIGLAGLEVWLRVTSAREAAPTLQGLFAQDDRIGYRLRPGAHLVFTTQQFRTDLSINAQGVRDADIGPKPRDEFRIVVIGDSMVLSIQSPIEQTFCRLLQQDLNARPAGPFRYRVINAGVQGYGPVEEFLFFSSVAATFEPDVVVIIAFVGNDAVEAADSGWRLTPNARPKTEQLRQGLRDGARRLARRSAAVQFVRSRFDRARELPLRQRPVEAYLEPPIPEVTAGFQLAHQSWSGIAREASALGARTAIALLPARFQLDDEDFGYLAAEVKQQDGRIVNRDLATVRFQRTLGDLGLPMIDLLPVLRAQPDRASLFFKQNVHLTARGHRIVADALAGFLRDQRLVVPSAEPSPGP